MACIRDLAVLLHRGNVKQAETALQEITGCLESAMAPAEGAGEGIEKRAQQTMFAIDEVRTLMAEGDFRHAAIAARDAAREWSQVDAAGRA